MNLCKNCKWCKETDAKQIIFVDYSDKSKSSGELVSNDICTNPIVNKNIHSTFLARIITTSCGENAKFFEQKDGE